MKYKNGNLKTENTMLKIKNINEWFLEQNEVDVGKELINLEIIIKVSL